MKIIFRSFSCDPIMTLTCGEFFLFVKISSGKSLFRRVLANQKIQAWHFFHFALNNLINSTYFLSFHKNVPLCALHNILFPSFSFLLVIFISQFIWWLSFNIWCYIFSINIMPSDYGLKATTEKSYPRIHSQPSLWHSIQFFHILIWQRNGESGDSSGVSVNKAETGAGIEKLKRFLSSP